MLLSPLDKKIALKEADFLARFSVATFNVNSVRSRLPVLERWLPANPVDILCLQETKVVDEDFPVEAFADLGYRVVFRGQKAYSGVALASRSEPDEVSCGFGDGLDPDDGPRLIRARFGDLVVVNTYVPQGKSIDHPDFEYKKAFLRRLAALFDRDLAHGGPLLWVGDLNVAPTEDDVTHPANKKDHVCFHLSIRELYAEVVEGRFVDVFRRHRPGPGEFSFWDYRIKNALERNIGWRIDHVLATPDLAERSVDCYADREPRGWERPSDHTVVVACFER